MWAGIKIALTGLLGSKKALLAIFGAVAAGLMKLGWNVDSDTVGLILAPLISAIIGQGIADVGKEQVKQQVATLIPVITKSAPMDAAGEFSIK